MQPTQYSYEYQPPQQQGITWKPLVIFGVIGLVAIIGLWFIAANGSLEVTYVGSPSNADKAELIVTNSNNEIVQEADLAKGQPFSKLLKTGEYTVRVSTEYEETVRQLSVKGFFRGAKADMELKAEYASDKIGSDSEGCDYLVAGQVYSTNCRANKPLYKLVPASGSKLGHKIEQMKDLELSRTKPYLDGVIAIAHPVRTHDIDTLEYVNLATNQRQVIKLPFPVEQASIYTDSISPGTTAQFAVVDSSSREIYFFQSAGDTAPKKITVESTTNLANPTWLYSLRGQYLAIYEGLGRVSIEDRNDNTKLKGFKNGRLLVYDSASGQNVHSAKVDKTLEPEEIQLLSANRIIIGNTENFAPYEITKNSIKTLGNPTPGRVFVYRGLNDKELVYGQDSEIFVYNIDEKVSQRIYQSDSVRFSSFGSSRDSLIFNGYLNGSDGEQKLHTFVLDTQRAAAYPRKEWFLPYTAAEVPVKAMDYYENEVVVALIISSFRVDKQTRQPVFSQTEYDTNRQAVLDKLKADGFDLNTLTVNFSAF